MNVLFALLMGIPAAISLMMLIAYMRYEKRISLRWLTVTIFFTVLAFV